MAQKKVRQAAGKKVESTVPMAHAVGRRKNAVARIWLRRGTGNVNVNGQDIATYFDTNTTRQSAVRAFHAYPMSRNYDVEVNVYGGGKVGQAGAIKLGIARAFVASDETVRPLMRKDGLLTVDARQKERKKYGRRGARRRFQFVKR